MVELRRDVAKLRKREKEAKVEAERAQRREADEKTSAFNAELRELKLRLELMSSTLQTECMRVRAVRAESPVVAQNEKVVEAEQNRHLAETWLSDMRAGVRNLLEMRATRLACKSPEFGELGAELTEALDAARADIEEAERRWEQKLDEIEQRLQGPHEKCILCLEWIRDGEQALFHPCHHVFHKDCILPALRNGTITGYPLDRSPVDPAFFDRLHVLVWGLVDRSDVDRDQVYEEIE